MKKLLYLICLCTITLSLTNCTVLPKDYIVDDRFDDEEESENLGETQLNRTLADLLRKNTSLVIEGSHPNVSVRMRGMSSINLETRVLFVVDGINMGHSYSFVESAVDINNVKKIKVLKGLSQTTIYGEDGRNGVVQIFQHKTDEK